NIPFSKVELAERAECSRSPVPVAQITAMPNATNKERQSSTRNDNRDLPCGLEIIETPEGPFTQNRRNLSKLTALQRQVHFRSLGTRALTKPRHRSRSRPRRHPCSRSWRWPGCRCRARTWGASCSCSGSGSCCRCWRCYGSRRGRFFRNAELINFVVIGYI